MDRFENTGCVIMASGMGKRFGGNKLMADFGGEPLILKTISAVEELTCVVAVTRHEDVEKLLKERDISVVLHDMPLRSDTVRLGAERIPDGMRIMFCQGDQPLLSRETVHALLMKSAEEPGFIWRTSSQGEEGSPVIFPGDLKEELMNLPEGKGGGFLIKKYPERVRLLEVDNPFELKDVDTVEDLEILENYTL